MKEKNQSTELRTILLLLTIVTITLITIVSSGVQLYLDYQKRIKGVESNLQFIAKSYLSPIIDSLWDFDESNVRMQLRGMLMVPGVKFCSIQDEEGIIGLSIEEGDSESKKDLVRTFPLTHENRPLGTLTLAANFDHIKSEMIASSMVVFASYGCAVLISAAIIFILSNYLLFRHFSSIAGYMEKLDIHHLETSLKLKRAQRKDELQLIVNAINDMRLRIQTGIEENRIIQEKLEYHHNVMKAQQEASWEGILIVDENGRVVSRNQRFNEIWQFDKTDVDTDDDQQLIEHVLSLLKDPEQFQSRIKTLYKNRDETSKDIIIFKDGRIIERRSGPIYDGGQKYFGRVWYFRDVTQETLAEISLRESEDKYRHLFNMESDGIFLIESETGKIVEANDAALAIYGYELPQILKLKNTDLSAEPDQTRSATDEKHEIVPVRYHKKKDGSIFPVEITATHFNWKNKDVHIAAVRDISFRINYEKEKKQMDLRLQQAQKMESIGNLAGGIAHDFNNILYPILGLSEMLLHDLPKNSFDYENTEEIFKAAIRGRDLVKQILAFSRQTEHVLAPVRFQNVLNEVLKLSRSTIPTNIPIDHDIDPDCGLINADATQLHQIVMNLVTNAYHAVEKTAGRISIQLKEAMIQDEPQRSEMITPGQYVELTVSDTGEGIDERDVDKIFEPYFTTKEKGRGTGLGLATVYGIVKEHQGYINVDSQAGVGTTFRVLFPLIRGQKEAEEPVSSFTQLRGTEKILLVDDEHAVAAMQEQILKRIGYTVFTFTSSVEALEAFQNAADEFDVVITDMTMPEMTGDMLARKILELRSDIPIIICTGFSEKIDQIIAEEIGIKGFLMKPVVSDELAQLVRKVIDNGKR
ncbi:MAG: response regulator [Desulfobacteraceae bacterium]|nr:MAG: response regulator [Desulfobacteraceae bacterium]